MKARDSLRSGPFSLLGSLFGHVNPSDRASSRSGSSPPEAQLTRDPSASSIYVAVVTLGARTLDPSIAMVSTVALTGFAAFFTCVRLGLALTTVRFVTFPRATLATLRALGRAVRVFFLCAFDGCLLRLAMIAPPA
jgi:hypothetical protein